jgi:hypothetical protein
MNKDSSQYPAATLKFSEPKTQLGIEEAPAATQGFSDEEIRNAARKRVSRIFNISLDSFSLDSEFGKDFNTTPNSWLKSFNELDIIAEDIVDVASASFMKEWRAGHIKITTVSDYCECMVRCYHDSPTDVAYILGEDYGKKKIGVVSITLGLLGIVCLILAICFGGVATFKTIFAWIGV